MQSCLDIGHLKIKREETNTISYPALEILGQRPISYWHLVINCTMMNPLQVNSFTLNHVSCVLSSIIDLQFINYKGSLKFKGHNKEGSVRHIHLHITSQKIASEK